jgi:hypothetical protein
MQVSINLRFVDVNAPEQDLQTKNIHYIHFLQSCNNFLMPFSKVQMANNPHNVLLLDNHPKLKEFT